MKLHSIEKLGLKQGEPVIVRSHRGVYTYGISMPVFFLEMTQFRQNSTRQKPAMSFIIDGRKNTIAVHAIDFIMRPNKATNILFGDV